jgi:DNA transformation protein
MSVTAEYKAYLEELFAVLPGSAVRRMFGGAGVFRHGLMYALSLDDGKICLKADEINIPDFEAEGCGPWQYERNGKMLDMGYWQMPERLADDPDELKKWAEKAFDVAIRADERKSPKQRKFTKDPM